MKKILFTILIFMTMLFQGCSIKSYQYINLRSKPSINYYTSQLKKDLDKAEDFSLSVFDLNFYKNVQVGEEDKKAFKNFLKSIKDDNFINETIEKDKKCLYRVFVNIDDDKYLLKVYADYYITLSPWDGSFNEDVINEASLPLGYKLDTFCKYILEKQLHNHINE